MLTTTLPYAYGYIRTWLDQEKQKETIKSQLKEASKQKAESQKRQRRLRILLS